MDVGLFDESGGSIPRPAWQIIDAARHARITGELRLEVDPAVSVWLRDGVPYFAERSTDGTLGVRLLVEGHITLPQLQRGTVTVNGVEHIGRMFELDTTVDRAVLEVWVEQVTDHVLVGVAGQQVERYTVSPYRRHPSGVDRWSAPDSGPTRRKGVPAPRANPFDPTQPLERHDDARTGGFARPTLAAATPSPAPAATPHVATPLSGSRAARITPVVIPDTPPIAVTTVPAPPAPPLLTAAPSRGGAPLPPIPIISTPPTVAPTGPVEKSLWIAVDPDPTPVADGAPRPAAATEESSPTDAPIMPTLAPRPGDMLDPTPNTLVRHITAAVRNVVANVDEPPSA